MAILTNHYTDLATQLRTDIGLAITGMDDANVQFGAQPVERRTLPYATVLTTISRSQGGPRTFQWQYDFQIEVRLPRTAEDPEFNVMAEADALARKFTGSLRADRDEVVAERPNYVDDCTCMVIESIEALQTEDSDGYDGFLMVCRTTGTAYQ